MQEGELPKNLVRIQWIESRDGSIVLILAEREGMSWIFYERDTWELRWFLVEDSNKQLELLKFALSVLRD